MGFTRLIPLSEYMRKSISYPEVRMTEEMAWINPRHSVSQTLSEFQGKLSHNVISL
jgi:hypothetical protein